MKVFTGLSLLVASVSVAVKAAAASSPIEQSYDLLFRYPRLIQTGENDIRLMSEAEIGELSSKHIGFMDITDTISAETSFLPSMSETPLPLTRTIKSPPDYFNKIDKKAIAEFITKFSTFHNRYFRAQYGKQSAEWLYDQASKVAQAAHSGIRVIVTKIQHDKWPQPSIIARVQPVSNKDNTGLNEPELTIISAHQDSTAGFGSASARAPGADDNASGSAVIFQIFSIITSSPQFKPETPIEFHWYAAEEGGLLGSQEIALSRRRTAQKIYGVLHFDMTGYNNGKDIVGITTDYTNPELTNYIRQLFTKYTKLKPMNSQCGYACSDHASWHKNGYRAAFPMETLFKESNPHIHTARDTLEKLNLDHMAEFVKMGIGFAVEMTAGDDLISDSIVELSTIPGLPEYAFPRLIQTQDTLQWMMNEEELEQLHARQVKFMDVTDTLDLERSLPYPQSATINPLPKFELSKIPFAVPTSNEIKQLLIFNPKLKKLTNFLNEFTAFHTRHFRSETGVQASEWLFNFITEIIEEDDGGHEISVRMVEHTRFPQPSIVVRVEGHANPNGPLTIISSHLDSTAGSPTKRSPGADDNGTGVLTCLVSLIIPLLIDDWKPYSPIEFHFYAGEEGGLLGSQEIALARRRVNQPVKAVLHFDMTGYTPVPNQVALVTDYTDPELTSLIKDIIETEENITVVETKCGYACSDHASWHKNGFRAAFPFEAKFNEINRNIHTEHDTIDKLTENHVFHFARTGIIFSIFMTLPPNDDDDATVPIFHLNFDNNNNDMLLK